MQYQQDKCTFFLLLCLRALLCFLMGPSSVQVLSDDVLFLLLHKMDLLDLYACDNHLQRVKNKESKRKFYMWLNAINCEHFINCEWNENTNTYDVLVMLFTYYFFSWVTITSNKPFWQRKCKCSGVSRVNVSLAMVTSWIVILFLCFWTHDIVRWK